MRVTISLCSDPVRDLLDPDDDEVLVEALEGLGDKGSPAGEVERRISGVVERPFGEKDPTGTDSVEVSGEATGLCCFDRVDSSSRRSFTMLSSLFARASHSDNWLLKDSIVTSLN